MVGGFLNLSTEEKSNEYLFPLKKKIEFTWGVFNESRDSVESL